MPLACWGPPSPPGLQTDSDLAYILPRLTANTTTLVAMSCLLPLSVCSVNELPHFLILSTTPTRNSISGYIWIKILNVLRICNVIILGSFSTYKVHVLTHLTKSEDKRSLRKEGPNGFPLCVRHSIV